MQKFILILILLFLAGCAGPAVTPQPKKVPVPVPKASVKKDFYTVPAPIQCVPYAREQSGIPIRGNAHTWWASAKGDYKRSDTPKEGAVMVLSKTSRLKYGHLAVVKNVINDRLIEVAHSNWGSDKKTRSVIYRAMPVQDVSSRGNWSSARFYNYQTDAFGRPYKVSGFIYP